MSSDVPWYHEKVRERAIEVFVEALRVWGNPLRFKNATFMEMQVFQASNSKDEYLKNIRMLISDVKRESLRQLIEAHRASAGPCPGCSISIPDSLLVINTSVTDPDPNSPSSGPVAVSPEVESSIKPNPYLEKFEQVLKYIGPATEVIARMRNEDSKRMILTRLENVEKLLIVPNKRNGMKALLKLEQILRIICAKNVRRRPGIRV